MEPPVIPEDTSFKGCWAQLARDRGLPEDPEALMPPTTVAQARRVALEIFSWGCRHQELTRRRLKKLALGRAPKLVFIDPGLPRLEQTETIYQPPGRLF